jgi:hypothetical protein
MAQELPQIFDQYGALIKLPESALLHLSVEARAAYDEVVTAYDAHAAVEKQIEAKTTELHSTVAELREVEHRVAMLPRPSRIDLVRSDLIAMNR